MKSQNKSDSNCLMVVVPAHYHVTEVGLKIAKAVYRLRRNGREGENVINFQLWYSHDYDHRIHPDKLLLKIIDVSEKGHWI
ncbi:MAG: DUF6428 family protein [Saprospiraceae bacterium]